MSPRVEQNVRVRQHIQAARPFGPGYARVTLRPVLRTEYSFPSPPRCRLIDLNIRPQSVNIFIVLPECVLGRRATNKEEAKVVGSQFRSFANRVAVRLMASRGDGDGVCFECKVEAYVNIN